MTGEGVSTMLRSSVLMEAVMLTHTLADGR